jgi:maltooligosyltrehalose trehalohydrolase
MLTDHTTHVPTRTRATQEPAPLGAVARGKATAFRVWAPRAARLELALGDDAKDVRAMARDAAGYWRLDVDDAPPGVLYRYRVDGRALPDPCSRFQPDGPHGPSLVVDVDAYRWGDASWTGIRMHGQVLYELHIGTFTPAGTFDAAIARLPALRDFGVTTIELMPVAEFPGRFNWGYDGVQPFAPYHGYGDYEALKRFVDAAHASGLGVILDVVYNHLGPDGNYLAAYAPEYFTDRYATDWGEPLNFDGPDAGPVRDYFVRNARHWIGDFHLDGLRLDATQNVYDATPRHILADITAAARAAAGRRSIIVVGENEPQQVVALASGEAGGWGLDALWNDDFHHSAHVALTGRHDGYYHDHRGVAQEFVSAARHCFLFQGQRYSWQDKPRGTPVTDEPAAAFITFLDNHDQVANTLEGSRLAALTAPARLRAMTALLLLAPQTPMLFMGQEFAASTPFTFFADHVPELAAKVHEGRRGFLRQFAPYAKPDAQRRVPDPADPATFAACKLDWSERERHAHVVALHKDLIALRRDDPVLARQRRDQLDGAVLGPHAFVLRWRNAENGDRLLVVNLRDDLDVRPAPEPLLAPPRAGAWTLAWSSDDPRYGGPGVVNPDRPEGWCLPGESAALFVAVPEEP